MQIWTFLHIISMFAAVTVIVGVEWWALYAIRRRDVGALRSYTRVAPGAERAGGLFFVAGIAFGLIAAVVIGWDLLALWLLIAYALVALIVVVGGAIYAPYLKRVEAGLPAEGDEISPELDATLSSRLPLVLSAISAAAVAGIVAAMVYKPSW